MGVLYTLAEAEELEERIEYRDTFTDAVSRDWKLPELDVCLISSSGEAVGHACLVARGDMVATYKRRIRFTDFVSLGEPLPFEELLREVPPNLKQHVVVRLDDGGIVPPKTWEALVTAVKKLRPDAAYDIERIEALARDPSPVFRGRGTEILALERDALGLALMIAEIDRTELLTWREPGAPAPFLTGLQSSPIIEDRLVDYDGSVFGEWKAVRRHPAGAVVFKDGRNELTVFNMNRTNVEHALGVDLVYYNHRFQSFVLVQYKRMRKENGRNVYRPDEALKKELERMRVVPVSRDPSEDPLEYRLHPGSCYLKLCPDMLFRPRAHELIRGMYLPLDYWDELIKSETTTGPRRGVAITFDNAIRHVNSSLFSALVRDGWVGSRLGSTELLETVVDELLAGRHSVTLAEYKRTH